MLERCWKGAGRQGRRGDAGEGDCDAEDEKKEGEAWQGGLLLQEKGEEVRLGRVEQGRKVED